jgi:glycosyltransferase involved in cell wall biosynthesis
MRLVINWAHREYFPVAVYQRAVGGRVLVMGGLADNARLLHLVRKSDQLVCFTVGDYREQEFEMTRRAIELFELEVAHVAVLCNYPAQVEMARSAGLRAYFCNHNAFIDESVFRPQLVQKRFDAVSNARLVKSKRVSLAREVSNLALIQGSRHERSEYDDPSEIPHAYLNQEHLTPRGVARVLSASRVGLALSEAEGACLASSEYLLCGLPVVSTPSVGGRDVWYDTDNSLICDPTPGAVRDAVDLLIARLSRGEIDPRAVREKHIARAEEHRQRFIDVTRQAFTAVAADADAEIVFRQTFVSKGITPRYAPLSELRPALLEH